jgi:predicted Zn-dependent protease
MGNAKKARVAVSAAEKTEMRRMVEEMALAGRHAEACDVLERLAALSPRNPLIWNDLGAMYEAAGENGKALAALRRSCEVDPGFAPALYNLGKMGVDRCMRQTDAAGLEEAIGFLKASLDGDPENALGHEYLARAYRLKGEERLAEAHRGVARRLRDGVAAEWEVG